MLLQEIFQPEYENLSKIYGLDINAESTDTQFSRPPKNFEVIGFNLKLGEDNLIDEQLLDLIISYKLTNIFVVLDVPSQFISQGLITPKNLIQLANNVDFSISLLPPKHPLVGDSINMTEYVEIIRMFNEEMMKKQNFDKMVDPISNFLEYLMLEKLLGKEHPAIKEFSPNNEYVKTTFLPYMTNEDSNMFKDVIRESLYDFYGGEDQFDLVANTIFEGIYNKSQEVFTGYVQEHIQQNKSDSETTN